MIFRTKPPGGNSKCAGSAEPGNHTPVRPGSILALLLAAFLTLWGPPALQAANGKVAGRVTDIETGRPLPGTNIFIIAKWEQGRPVSLTDILGASADEDGYYIILNVPPEAYDIRAEIIGYTPQVNQAVRVSMDRTTGVDFGLKPTVLELEQVQVIAHREIIKPDIAGTQEIITTDRIHVSPVLRMDEFVDKLKGVDLVAGNDGHGLSIRGGAIRETEVRIDGISARDPRSENAYLSFNSTSVEELQVLSGGFQAKYGGFRSGLVNAVTKEGNPEQYTFSFKADYTPRAQPKFFGINPWSDESWVYRVFADTSATGFAYTGTYNDTSGLVPPELSGFRGWNYVREGVQNYPLIGLTTGLTSEQKRRLWLIQHPRYAIADEPDRFYEGTVTGPLPGRGLPVVGGLLTRSSFLIAGKYEYTQFAYPIGPRPGYRDWNTQCKLTLRVTPRTKLALNAFYAQIETNTGNRPSTLGGALMDYSSRFSFLSGTQASLEQQARILGSGTGFVHMFNRSRLQTLDQRWIISGLSLNHTLSPHAFFTLDLQAAYTDNRIAVFTADTSRAEAWTTVDSIRILNYPHIGTPNGSTNLGYDINNFFTIYGGLQQVDSSYSWTANLDANLTVQIGRYHELETGFNLRLIRAYVNSGTWYQSEQLWTPGVPDTWQYYTVEPVEAGIYLQDKLEFEGLVATLGVRGDYFNPRKDAFSVQHPLDEDYANFYHLVYEYLPGKWGSWERWSVYRDMLDNPPGWPVRKNRVQFKLSPRLGVSFPTTVNSKLYFNYGHFYQRPNFTFLYNLAISTDEAVVPSTDLEFARTVAYEFGYEQHFLRDYLFNLTLYYKNITAEPLQRTYINYWQEYQVSRYFPDAFADIRGIEVRLEKNIGRFLTFWGNYEYMLKSWGQTGLRYVYENRIIARDEERSPNVTSTEPLPKAHLNFSFHTPVSWGPSLFGLRPLGGFFVDFLAEWRDGGKIVIQEDPLTGRQRRAEVMDFTNLDLRASKQLRVGNVNMEVVLTVTNLLNQQRLFTGGMSTDQYHRYRESLCFPWEEGEFQGHDRWGEFRASDVAYDPLEALLANPDNDPEISARNEAIQARNRDRRANNAYIDTGWFTAPLFLNPRQILLGIRVNI